MYQGQIKNSKYVWSIFVIGMISARFILLKNYTLSLFCLIFGEITKCSEHAQLDVFDVNNYHDYRGPACDVLYRKYGGLL